MHMLPYLQALEMLHHYDVEIAPSRLVDSAQEAVETAEILGYPVALKVISPDLSHKSELGLVRLDLKTPEAVSVAARELLAAAKRAAPADSHVEGLLVQEMIPPGVEMIVGVHRDPQFGPLVALGSGGIWVELLDDMQLRLPPLSHKQAAEMIRETRSRPLLQGYRHFAPADVAALTRLLVNISRLAAAEERWISGLDLNPVIVLPEGQGIRVVDLRVAVSGLAADL